MVNVPSRGLHKGMPLAELSALRPLFSTGESGYWAARLSAAEPVTPIANDVVMPPLPVWPIRKPPPYGSMTSKLFRSVGG